MTQLYSSDKNNYLLLILANKNKLTPLQLLSSNYCHISAVIRLSADKKGKGTASSLDIAPLTILNSGALQPRKWQLTGNDCSTAAHAVAAQSPR